MSAFQIPELASLICHFSDLSSCARLASVSRATFRAAVPFVWHTVDGADKLLSLVPNTTRKYADQQKKKVAAIEIPSFTDFGRYRIYAPHVRHLDVYGKNQHFFQVIGWHIIITKSQLQFLPSNLQSLKIRTLDHTKADEQLFWISAFASSSTQEISIMPSNPKSGKLPWVTWTTTSVMLQTILDQCPNIQRLGIYPCIFAPTDRPGDKGTCFLSFLSQKSFEELIGSLQNLTELSTTTAMLDPDCFSELGQLPHLESLTVYESQDGLYDSHQLADTAFPALRKLTLFLSDEDEVSRALSVTALVRRLVTLSIHLWTTELEDWFEADEDVASWLATHCLQHIKSATHLEDLSFHFDMREDRGSVLVLERFAHVITHLSTLPLKKLALQAVEIPVAYVVGLEGGLDNPIWSSLTHLRLPNLGATNLVLTCLSALPRLQYLHVKLLISEGFVPPAASKDSASPLRTLEGSRGSTIKAHANNFDKHIKLLLTIWPNLEHIIWPEGANELEDMYITFLNRHLKSRPRRLPKGGSET